MTQTIALWNGTIPAFREDADTPNKMTAYLIDTDKPLPAVVVFPGGGYCERAPYEGKPIAEFYNAAGFQAFVVEYRVRPNSHPAPLADAQRAIRLVRANAAQWGVDPDRIIVCGFSAGGHLAGSAAVLTEDVSAVGDEYDRVSFRPNGAILCYAVISGLPEHGYIGTHENLLGDRYEELRDALSLQKHVTADTPPCFLWHTREDNVVPVAHAHAMVAALEAAGVPYESHIFPYGCHGLGLAEKTPGVCQWPALSADWIRRL